MAEAFVLLTRDSEHGQSTVAGRLTWDFTSVVRRCKFRSLYARFRENTPFRSEWKEGRNAKGEKGAMHRRFAENKGARLKTVSDGRGLKKF